MQCIAPEYPQAFDSEGTFNNLTEFLKHENDTVCKCPIVVPYDFVYYLLFVSVLKLIGELPTLVASAALQILMNTGTTLKEKFPDTCEHLLQTLQSMVKIGSPRQAKHAVRCLANMFDNKEELFDGIAQVLKNYSLPRSLSFTPLLPLLHSLSSPSLPLSSFPYDSESCLFCSTVRTT